MDFFKINMIIFIVGALLLVFSFYLEHKFSLLSEKIQIKPILFYGILVFFTLLIALLNFIALTVFGGWQSFILTIIALIIVGFIVWLILRLRKHFLETAELVDSDAIPTEIVDVEIIEPESHVTKTDEE